MAIDEQECSPLDFWLSQHGYTFDKLFPIPTSLLVVEPRSPELKMVNESLQFRAWDVLNYLRTVRVPTETLETLFSNLPLLRRMSDL